MHASGCHAEGSHTAHTGGAEACKTEPSTRWTGAKGEKTKHWPRTIMLPRSSSRNTLEGQEHAPTTRKKGIAGQTSRYNVAAPSVGVAMLRKKKTECAAPLPKPAAAHIRGSTHCTNSTRHICSVGHWVQSVKSNLQRARVQACTVLRRQRQRRRGTFSGILKAIGLMVT